MYIIKSGVALTNILITAEPSTFIADSRNIADNIHKAAKNISYYVVLNDKEEKVGEINLDAPIEKIVFVEFRHNISPDGSVLYVDDVKIVKK